MITERDFETVAVMKYLIEDLEPALERHVGKDSWLDDVEYSSTRIKADLRKIRRLATRISKNLEWERNYGN